MTESQLNAYISAGIIPEPVGAELEGHNSNKAGNEFFPGSVVWRINLVKRLESEGESMAVIAGQFGDIALVEEIEIPAEKKHNSIKKKNYGFTDEEPDLSGDDKEDDDIPILLENKISGKPKIETEETRSGLTLKQIHFPAYLVNSRLEIEWINHSGEGLFFHQDIGVRKNAADRNVFKLLFGFVIQSNLDNWKELLLLHMHYFRSNYGVFDLETLCPGMARNEMDVLKESYTGPENVEESTLPFPVIHWKAKNCSPQAYQVQTVEFKEGLLYVYVPVDLPLLDVLKYEASRKSRIQNLLGENNYISSPLCVLSACLSHSDKLRDSMMPESYFELLNEICHVMETCCKKHNGIKGQNKGDQAQLYFLQNERTNYIADAVNCALDILGAIKRIKQTGKAFTGLLQDDVYLNIGVAEGTEFLGSLKSEYGFEIKVLGDALNHADLLSELSGTGEVWATKSAIGKLGSYALKNYEFGIHRHSPGKVGFMPGVFAKIKDVIEDGNLSFKRSVPDLAVTNIRASIKDSLK